MIATLDKGAADLRRANAELQRQIVERTAERDEALEQQTATAEVLQVINSSPGDLAPVFDAMLERAMRLCEAQIGGLAVYDGEHYRVVASRGVPAALVEFLKTPPLIQSGSMPDRLRRGEDIIQVADLANVGDTELRTPGFVAMIELGRAQSTVWVSLRKDHEPLGFIAIYRQEVRPFTDKQITLLQNFAAQAVIAMENARLITETREALEQQTATAKILQVINSSPGDLGPVFDALLDKATRLCDFAFSILWTYDGEAFSAVAMHGVPPRYAEYLAGRAIIPPPNTRGAFSQFVAGKDFFHINDVAATEVDRLTPRARGAVEIGGARTNMLVALRKEGGLLGAIEAYRLEVRPFSDKQIALLQNFAAQAVIAMENARLITETREALEQQTATAEVLQVINSSPGDLTPVFEAMLEKATRLCEASFGILWQFDDGLARAGALHRVPEAFAEFHREPMRPTPGSGPARMMQGEGILAIPNLLEFPPYQAGDPMVRAIVELAGARSVVIAPLRKDGATLGAITIYRQEVRPFSDKQIALLRNFAAQAVIAMENARLLDGIRAARDAAETALRGLKAAQANLIQAEKMASLGQLTAGIAHEIKNPLNFVNNFANLSVELLDELKAAAGPAIAGLDGDTRAEIDETIGMLTSNLEKIGEHGRRADGIVRSMLEHSRGGSGERRSVDLNGLVEEALNLAYHGARAQDQSFNITLDRDFAEAIAPIDLVPQDVTRVFLNLFGNGFYAASKRRMEADDSTFRPTVTVTTRDLGDGVEIRVRDNGTGISAEIKDKLFQPFFTTKPTGEGTGLGLSISYDIVTQQHGGTIAVDSQFGEFTEFTIRLPRDRQATGAGAAA